MTLSRQLISLILITFLLIFSGTFWISVDNTRSYLMLQLATQTQNAADSLGLSLVPHLQRQDIAAMDTMVNAVFDSGYYQSLKLTNMSGKPLIERENTNKIEGVPQWFINQLPLPVPQAESIITTGWTQAGRLSLVAHPGFAYKKLWETTQQTFIWSCLAFVLALIAVLFILKTILRPLDAVEQQALAISKREFPIMKHIPRTRELRRVVLAMNKMSEKLQAIINKLSQRAEQLRQEAHGDVLTGVGNRRAFQVRLEHTLHDREHGGSGALAVIRIWNLSDYNLQIGKQAGDDLLVNVAHKLQQITESYPQASLSRINGTDFAIILPLSDNNVASEFGQQVSAAMTTLAANLALNELAHTGIARFDNDSDMASILTDADAALSSASHQGSNTFVIQDIKSEAMGNDAWKLLIEQALQHRSIQLVAQPVVNSDQEAIYRELLIRIHDQSGQPITPGLFASMADRLGLQQQLDQYVLSSAMELLATVPAMQRLAVNLSPLAVNNSVFRDWLNGLLTKHHALSERLLFEISEHGLLQDIDQSASFIELAHQHRVQVVMEHFGTRLSSFQSLSRLKVDYIKLSGSYTRDITHNPDNRFFIQTITDIAHSLDIAVIAEQIESDDDLQSIQTLGIQAMQGYYFGEPAPLSERE